jgi:hypothetical protein
MLKRVGHSLHWHERLTARTPSVTLLNAFLNASPRPPLPLCAISMFRSSPSLIVHLRLLLLIRNIIAASDVEHVVKCAVALDIKATFLRTGRLSSADTGWIGSSTGSRVGVFGSGRCVGKRCKRSDDDKEFHFGA